jgi:flagellin
LLKGDAGTKEITLKGHDAGVKGSLSDQGATAKFEVKLETDSDISISSHTYHIYEEGDETTALQAKLDDADKVTINGTTYTRVTSKPDDPEPIVKPTAEQLSDRIDTLSKNISTITTQRDALVKCADNKATSVTAKQECITKFTSSRITAKETCIEKFTAKSIAGKEACLGKKEVSLAKAQVSLANKQACLELKESAHAKALNRVTAKEEELRVANEELEAALARVNDESLSVEERTAAGEEAEDIAKTISTITTQRDALVKCADNKLTSVTTKSECVTKFTSAKVTAKETCIEKFKTKSIDGKRACLGKKQVSLAKAQASLSGKQASLDEKAEAYDKAKSKVDAKQTKLEEAQAELDATVEELKHLDDPVPEPDPIVKTGTFVSDDKEYQLNELKGMIKDGTKVGFGDGKARTAVDLSTNRNNITVDEAKTKIQDALLQANQIGADDETSVKVDEAKDAGNNTYSYEITKGTVTVAKEKSFELHVGADADLTNKITVNIETMNSKYLGVQNLNVVDDSGIAATYAIDAIEDALSKVSEQRSALGAVQNRLEHTIANLDNVVENTQSAESGIRDTDIADEMVRYSKNNILSQAGQSMLAQANQSTQGALSLLG